MNIQRARWGWLVRPLCLLIALGPCLAASASAQAGGPLPPIERTVERNVRPGPFPRPMPGVLPEAEQAPFLGYGTGLGVEAENGFVISMANGEWRHDGHAHVGGTGAITSPWGEEMPIRYWFNSDGSFAVEYDRNATIHYSLDEFGGLREVMSVTEEGVSSAFVGNRAQRLGLGSSELWSMDFEPYRALLSQIGRNHSEEFLAGAERLQTKLIGSRFASPAGCAGDIISCTASILGWIATVPAIAVGCTSGGAITFGLACLGAILAHEAASASAVGSCINAIQNCSESDEQGDPAGGCSGPGGRE